MDRPLRRGCPLNIQEAEDLVGLICLKEGYIRFDHTNEKGQKNDVPIELGQIIRMTSQGQRVWIEKRLEQMVAEGLLRKVYAITELGRQHLRENIPF
jgi:hypothetical protein